MARKDEIFKSFLQHELLKDKYKIDQIDLPITVQEGLNSNHAIVKAIALIVENTENHNPATDNALYTLISQFLNVATI